jgi:argonaute-like protein implicated in RNA metabolism and viral defense
MELDIRIKMNEKLFLRNPEESVLGKKMVKHGLILINKLGFEEFTFKKLSIEISTTEASIYRYFENKHKFLIYLINWYWSYLEHKVVFNTNNISNPQTKINHWVIRTSGCLGEIKLTNYTQPCAKALQQ